MTHVVHQATSLDQIALLNFNIYVNSPGSNSDQEHRLKY